MVTLSVFGEFPMHFICSSLLSHRDFKRILEGETSGDSKRRFQAAEQRPEKEEFSALRVKGEVCQVVAQRGQNIIILFHGRSCSLASFYGIGYETITLALRHTGELSIWNWCGGASRRIWKGFERLDLAQETEASHDCFEIRRIQTIEKETGHWPQIESLKMYGRKGLTYPDARGARNQTLDPSRLAKGFTDYNTTELMQDMRHTLKELKTQMQSI